MTQASPEHTVFYPLMRRLLPITHPALALLWCLWVSAAHADPTAECVDQHFGAQGERASGALLRARSLLEACSAPHCPGPVKSECGAWLAEVQADLPSVVLSVSTVSGTDVAPSEVWLDDSQVAPQLGLPLSVDPGRHEFRVRTAGGATYSKVFVAQLGRKRRPVSLVVPEDAGEQSSFTRRITWPVVAGAGLGAAGFVGLGVFGSMARSGETELEECSPNCSEAAIDSVKTDYLLANVSLGVGAAGLVTAVLWYIFDTQAAAHESTANAAPTFDVSRDSGGGARLSFGLRGEF